MNLDGMEDLKVSGLEIRLGAGQIRLDKTRYLPSTCRGEDIRSVKSSPLHTEVSRYSR